MTFDEVEYVYINEAEITEVAAMNGRDVPPAIVLNSNDNGFGFFRIDDSSMKHIEENLSKITHQLNKAVVLSQIIIMIRTIKYPATRLPLILK